MVAFLVTTSRLSRVMGSLMLERRHELALKTMMMMNPKKVLEDAKHGCITSANFLLNAVEKNELPSKLFVDALDVFTSHLSGVTPKYASNKEIRLANIGFEGAFLLRQGPHRSLVVYSLLKNWTEFLDWARFLVLKDARGRLPSLKPLRDRLSSLLSILFAIYGHWSEDKCRHALLHPTLLKVITCIWFVDDSDVGPADKMFCTLLVNRYLAENAVDKSSLDYILLLIHEKAERLISLLLHLILVASQCEPPNLEAIHLHTTLLRTFNSRRGHPLDLAIWKRQYAWDSCFGLLTFSAQSSTGLPLITQAIQCGLLRNFAICSPVFIRFSASVLDNIRKSFLISIPAYLAYHSVTTCIEVEIGSLSIARRQQASDSALGDTWKAFLRFFFERFLFKCHYDYGEAIHDIKRSCEECGGRGSGPLKKCGACKKATYCSKECQAAAWREHKADCKLLRQHVPIGEHIHNRDTARLSWKNRDYMKRLAGHDIRRHLPGLRNLAMQKYPDTPFDSLGITLDYCPFPPILDILPITSLMTEDDASTPCSRTLSTRSLDRARRSNGANGFMKVISSKGQGCLVLYEDFPWTMPPFWVSVGESQNIEDRSMHMTVFQDPEGKPVEAARDIADELMNRTGLKPDALLEAVSMTDLRRKVIDVLAQVD
ncbi:hypothetical protein DFH11DRAFT_1741037 [Phellopilus nigrolimitatus]|nr:hypothetical protein DFH11DRAFT_1741037 [Phellopilus nigrolimitatus]